MSTIKKLPLASLPPAQRELAERLSHDPAVGDPDTASISNIELKRAWADVASFTASERATLAELSRQLGVDTPTRASDPPTKTKAERIAEVLGPPRMDERTGQVTRKTRIIATLGPASRDVDTIARMINAGMDVARVNFSHIKSEDDARSLIDNIHAAMAQAGRPVKILADLPGPKIRVDDLHKPVDLIAGQRVVLGSAKDAEDGAAFLPVDPPGVLSDLRAGERIFLDDGKIALEVLPSDGDSLVAKVLKGGAVKSRKGINLPDTRLSERVPTADDLALMEIAKSLGVRLFTASFVEDEHDMSRMRAALGDDAQIIAKIERPAALENLDAIYAQSDAIMVARGDLGVELGDAQTPVAQTRMHSLGNRVGVPTGTATQMLESMTDSVRPTRAEASDVYRSVVEGAEFVMTSGETAVGGDPVGVLEQMSKIVETSELAVRTGTVSGAQ
jgi:pyruvate kinase